MPKGTNKGTKKHVTGKFRKPIRFTKDSKQSQIVIQKLKKIKVKKEKRLTQASSFLEDSDLEGSVFSKLCDSQRTETESPPVVRGVKATSIVVSAESTSPKSLSVALNVNTAAQQRFGM